MITKEEIKQKQYKIEDNNEEDEEEENNNTYNNKVENNNNNEGGIDLLDLGGGFDSGGSNNINMNNNQQSSPTDLLNDLGSLNLGGPMNNNNMEQSMGGNINNSNVQRFVVIQENKPGVMNPNKGLEVEASVFSNYNNYYLSIQLTNKSAGGPINNFVMQFNNNPFGLSVNPNCLSNVNLQPGQSFSNSIPLERNPQGEKPVGGQSTIQTGFRCNLNEYYFLLPIIS
ncbi:MAG: hypothetical protein MJ209_07660 [archaeon]|nr:hypothetical protein [archaeon]